jgi:hypothetical protein
MPPAKTSSSAAQEAINLSGKISEFLSVTQSEIEQLNASVGTGIGGLKSIGESRS